MISLRIILESISDRILLLCKLKTSYVVECKAFDMNVPGQTISYLDLAWMELLRTQIHSHFLDSLAVVLPIDQGRKCNALVEDRAYGTP